MSWAGTSDSFRTAAIPTLLITELMASNQTTLTTRLRASPGGPLGETMMPDWIEIYNPSNDPLSLAGLHLTDDRADRTKWSFPAGAEIGPQSYLVVFASSENILDTRLDQRGSYHTSFKLSIEGEYLAVTAADGTVIHEYDPGFPSQRTDVSYGIDAVAQAHYYATATPGADNVSGEINFVKDTTFTEDRGFFTEAFTVEITTRTPGATIAYTVDGSIPSLTHGIQVPAASDDVVPVAGLTISSTTTLRAAAFKSGFEPTDVDTQTYLFLDDVLQQSETFGKDGSGLPDFTAWGHSGKNGDWEVDPDIVHHADPENRLTTDDLRAVPTLSLVLPWEDMFVWRDQGIYISGTGSPRAVSVEQILGDGTTGFQIDGSVQIQGGSSTNRWKADKLSMRLKFTERVRTHKAGQAAVRTRRHRPLRHDRARRRAELWLGPPSTGQTGYAKFIQDQHVANLQNAMGGTRRTPVTTTSTSTASTGACTTSTNARTIPLPRVPGRRQGRLRRHQTQPEHGGQRHDGELPRRCSAWRDRNLSSTANYRPGGSARHRGLHRLHAGQLLRRQHGLGTPELVCIVQSRRSRGQMAFPQLGRGKSAQECRMTT